MSAALLWIFLPAVVAAAAAVWAERLPWLQAAACFLAAGLAYAAWVLPLNAPVLPGVLQLQITPEFVILGRRLVIDQALLRIVGVLYAAIFLWCLGSLIVRSGRFFIPTALTAGAFLVSAWSVQPWQFAGIFIMLAVLILLPMLSPPGAAPGQGVMRFVAFQTVGVPFFLLAGTLMEGIESIPAGLPATIRPSILLGFAFAFLLAAFPFHAWVPVLFEKEDPYVVAFIQVLLPLSVGVLGMQIIDRYLWLRGSEAFFAFVRSAGIINVLVGGIWAVSQRHAGRIFAFTALVDTGILLIALGSGPGSVPALYFSLAAARCISFFAFAVGLKIAQDRRGRLSLAALQGLSRESPAAAAAILIGPFSLAGLPLLAGFISRLPALSVLFEHAPAAAAVMVLGMAATGAAGLRLMAAVVTPADPGDGEASEEVRPDRWLRVQPLNLLGFGAALLVIAAGMLPGWTRSVVVVLQEAFVHLSR